MKREPKSVKVMCGEFSARYKELVGKNLAAAKEFLKGKVDIAEGMVAIVDNEIREDEDALRAGDIVQFELPAVTATCGANEIKESKLVDKTVAYARKTMREPLNIPRGANAFLNGGQIARQSERVTKLAARDKLEFIKEDGEKG